MILKTIQRQIEALYHFELPYDVEKFLVVLSLPGREFFFIRQTAEGVEVGLSFDLSVLETLNRQNPYESLDGKNLEAFLIAVEGVSHFLYFSRRAMDNQPVSRLELELQAEIDKYLLAALLFCHHQRRVPDSLFSTLFEHCLFERALSRRQKERYATANRFATRFCADLERNYIRRGRWRDALEKARRFYFLNHWSKIRALTP